VAAIVMFAHRGNIVRLLHGTENRFQKVRIFKR
jgi:glycerol-3-phosphate acyltransferase PlsY